MIRPAGSPTVTLLRLLPGSYQYNQLSLEYIYIINNIYTFPPIISYINTVLGSDGRCVQKTGT